MKVKPLHSVEGDALFIIVIEIVDEALEGIEVAFVAGYVRSKTASFLIHVWHLFPPLVKYIELFTRLHHGFLLVAATHDIYEPIPEVIVGSKGGTTIFN